MIDNRIPTRGSIRALAFGLALAFLAGCQSGGTRPDGAAATPGPTGADAAVAPTDGKTMDPLLARATERWQLLIAGKFAEAYEYLSPGYREVVDREEYVQTMAKRQVFWNAAEAHDQECRDGFCRVRVDVLYTVNMPVMGVGEVSSSTTVIENWLLGEDGRWYFVPERNR
jgi:hypothetical protein